MGKITRDELHTSLQTEVDKIGILNNNFVYVEKIKNIDNKKEIIAHRGFEKIFPENTITAFSGAFALGADSIEFDIRPCADGTYVVMHDDTVDRTTNGTGSVISKTIDELKQLDAGIKFSSFFAGTKIPTFEESLIFCKDKFKMIYFELKFSPTQEQISEIVDIVRSYNMIEQVCVESFYVSWLEMVRQEDQNIRLCYVGDATSTDIQTLKDLGRSMCAFERDYILANYTLVNECLENGVGVAAWNVNRPHEYQNLVNIGITRIMSNRPY
jgi:glycerophosphoryl diester phosphodiesterase